jgi:cephalosporin hydroxylase
MNTLTQTVKRTAYRVAPGLAKGFDEWLWFRKKTNVLRRQAPKCQTPADHFAILKNCGLATLQKPAEITGLLALLAELRPERVCEIGSYDGGTLFLFAQMATPHAHVISLDIEFGFSRRSNFPRLVRAGQTLTCIEADSHAEATRERLRSVLGGAPLDFLFIDGDHTLGGVTRDFELYSPLVRPGGLIAFHDIVPDFRTRFGTPTASNGGEVWKLWNNLKARYPAYREFFQEGPEQDGYGIGVLTWPGAPRP